MNWIARTGALALGVAWGCTTTNERHCGNQNGDATCMDRGFMYCDRCSAENDGCSNTINTAPGCHDGVAGTESSSSGGATSTVTTDTTTMSTSMTTSMTSTTTDPTDESGSSTGSQPCGNGVIDGDEACDGEDLNGHDCVTEGLGGGTISCTGDCMLDLSECMMPKGCGDGVVQDGEQCDMTDFGRQTCMGFSPQYGGGSLTCNANCTINPINCCVAQFQNCSLSPCCEGFACNAINSCL
ncbi:MAG TPA: hypothetical protein VG755_34045 [Nannocystaceae bacterium]|nr:hypothetical protein [Nannocystaceae bacterium]